MKHFSLDRIAKLLGVATLAAIALAVVTIFSAVSTTKAQNNASNKSLLSGKQHTPAISGTVSAVNSNAITVNGSNGTSYSVDAGEASVIRYSNLNHTTSSLSSIQTGEIVKVFGPVSGSNVKAARILVGSKPTKQAPVASGTVSAINGNTLTLNSNGTIYTVDASNTDILVRKSGVSLGAAAVQVNDTVEVSGTLSGTNIVATRILDGEHRVMPGHGPHRPGNASK